MKVIKKIEKKIFIPIMITSLLVIIIYSMLWLNLKKSVIKYFNSYSATYEITYDSIKVTGFPFILKATVNNLNIKIDSKAFNNNINIEKLKIRNLVFTKAINLLFDGPITITDSTNNKFKIEMDNHGISFILGKNNIIDNIDTFLEKVNINNDIILNNVTFKLITVFDQNYENRTLRINIDQIIKENLESNFELIFSNVKNLENNKVISIKNILDKFIFNDITNNYSINIVANNSSSTYNKSFLVDAELSITNYNSLVATVNNKDSKFIFNKENISNILQTLYLLPENEKNTKGIKYYSLTFDLINKSISINNTNGTDIIKKALSWY